MKCPKKTGYDPNEQTKDRLNRNLFMLKLMGSRVGEKLKLHPNLSSYENQKKK